MSAFSPGQRVTWVRQLRGGYGYTEAVPAIVLRVTDARVVISARNAAGARMRRTVMVTSLREPRPGEAQL
jgi:hypothetical protein